MDRWNRCTWWSARGTAFSLRDSAARAGPAWGSISAEAAEPSAPDPAPLEEQAASTRADAPRTARNGCLIPRWPLGPRRSTARSDSVLHVQHFAVFILSPCYQVVVPPGASDASRAVSSSQGGNMPWLCQFTERTTAPWVPASSRCKWDGGSSLGPGSYGS